MNKVKNWWGVVWDALIGVVSHPKFINFITPYILKNLGKNAIFRSNIVGWVAKEAVEEVIEAIDDIGDYYVGKKEIEDINAQDDRDDVADNLNGMW